MSATLHDQDMGEILVAARAMCEREGPEQALSMLRAALPLPEAGPAPYLALLGRLVALAGRHAEAVEYFLKAAKKFRQTPGWVHRDLGDAYLALRRFDLAGQRFSLVLSGGDKLYNLNQMLACEAYRQRSGDGETIRPRIIERLAVTDFTQNVCYLPIPKAACSVIKATVLLNGDLADAYRQSGKTIHDFAATAHRPAVQGTARPFCFTMIRDPLSRLLSTYLNKFVRDVDHGRDMALTGEINRTIRRAQRKLNLARDPARSISFEQFVQYLAQADDLDMDPHWQPQISLTGRDMSLFDHVGVFERLDDTLALLQTRFGYLPQRDLSAHIRFPTGHVTRYDPSQTAARPFQLYPADLRKMKQGFPPAAGFYPDRLADIVRKRYADDVALHKWAIGGA
jgi:tetratricopeptide (TPR) repeat protein